MILNNTDLGSVLKIFSYVQGQKHEISFVLILSRIFGSVRSPTRACTRVLLDLRLELVRVLLDLRLELVRVLFDLCHQSLQNRWCH